MVPANHTPHPLQNPSCARHPATTEIFDSNSYGSGISSTADFWEFDAVFLVRMGAGQGEQKMKQRYCLASVRRHTSCACIAIFAIVLIGIAPKAYAQGYPNRIIRYVVPAAAGSGTDLIARSVAQPMENVLGQNIVIENKPIAQGMVAASDVARSAPDGYTLLETTSTLVGAFSALKKQLQYDPVKDFAPIIRFVTAGLLLVVRSDFPARNLQEFLAYARAHPGELTGAYATGSSQMALALLKSLAGINCLEVAYKGTPQAVNDLLGGHIAFIFSDYPIGFTQMRAGKLRGLAVTSRDRTPLAPDIPALAEQLTDFDVTIWSGLVAPAGTPRQIIQKLYEAANQAIVRPDIKSELAKMSVDVAPLGPDDFGKFSRDEVAKWIRQAKAAGIQAE